MTLLKGAQEPTVRAASYEILGSLIPDMPVLHQGYLLTLYSQRVLPMSTLVVAMDASKVFLFPTVVLD